MLKIANLYASYGGIKALRGVSIEVNDGEAVAVLGANGAGKSTLLKAISGVMKSQAEKMTFLGERLPTDPHHVVKAGIVHVPEGRQIFPNLTVLENLRVGAFLRNDLGGINNDLKKVYEMFPILEERKNQYGGLLSGGEQQMLAISRGLMAKPKLLLLDEPSLGLAPIIVKKIFQTLKEINNAGTSLLIVEQNAFKALGVAQRGYILSTGEIVKSGTSEELLADKNLSKAYLGA